MADQDPVKEPSCEWVWDGEFYSTSCNQAFVFEVGSLIENNCYFCQNCGKKIKEIPREEDEQ